jgi:hypothetical protein
MKIIARPKCREEAISRRIIKISDNSMRRNRGDDEFSGQVLRLNELRAER